MTPVLPTGRLRWWFTLLLTLTPGTGSAQTPITSPVNSFAPAEDVELGREAASVIRTRLPILTDGRVEVYVNDLGRRLADAIPERFRQPGFAYTFATLNDMRVNSFALPGGPVFISRGMIGLAPTEGALAGLIAHELSHVVLRHATAQVSGGERYQVGGITGRAIGTALSGPSLGIMSRGADFSVGTYFLMYGRELEWQADILAVEIAARAGHNPREMGVMLHAIESEGAHRGGGLWMTRHPAPGYGGEEISQLEAICHEVALLGIEAPKPGWDLLPEIQMRLSEVPTPRVGQDASPVRRAPADTRGHSIEVPAAGSQRVNAGDLLQLSVPVNWHRLLAANTAIFAPEGVSFAPADGLGTITHGLQVGVARSLTGGLKGDLQALLESFSRGSWSVIWTPAYQRVFFGRQSGLTTTLSSVSPVTGAFESVSVWAVSLTDGSFLYFIGVAPQVEASLYRNTFNLILESMQIVN